MIFVTSLRKVSDDTLWEGPRLEANSWEEAEHKCRIISQNILYYTVELVGKFISEIDYEDAVPENHPVH